MCPPLQTSRGRGAWYEIQKNRDLSLINFGGICRRHSARGKLRNHDAGSASCPGSHPLRPRWTLLGTECPKSRSFSPAPHPLRPRRTLLGAGWPRSRSPCPAPHQLRPGPLRILGKLYPLEGVLINIIIKTRNTAARPSSSAMKINNAFAHPTWQALRIIR